MTKKGRKPKKKNQNILEVLKCKSGGERSIKVPAGVGMLASSTFCVLSCHQLLPCNTGFFLLTAHKYLIIAQVQTVESVTLNGRRKRSSKNKGQGDAGTGAAWDGNSWSICQKCHAGRKSHICLEGPANVTVFSCTHLLDLWNVSPHHIYSASSSCDRAFSFLSQ